MPITSAIPTQAKADWLAGVHTSADTYKIALYTSAATLDSTTTTYTTTNEVVGAGYTAGGATLTGFAIGSSGTTAWVDFADASWASATITARGAMIYNSSKTNKAVAIIDFGSDVTSTNGTFAVQFPAPAAATAIIRLG